MTKHTVKPDERQIKIMRHYWERMRGEQEYFFQYIANLEEEMSIKTGIPDLEFFTCDGSYVGIGNGPRTMALIQEDDLLKRRKRGNIKQRKSKVRSTTHIN